MKLQIDDMWSDDLQPSRSGLPENSTDFEIWIYVVLSGVGQIEHHCFVFRVMSPSSLAKLDSLTFIQNTMVLHEFDWDSIRNRLEKLFMYAQDCKDWTSIVQKFNGFLQYKCDW